MYVRYTVKHYPILIVTFLALVAAMFVATFSNQAKKAVAVSTQNQIMNELNPVFDPAPVVAQTYAHVISDSEGKSPQALMIPLYESCQQSDDFLWLIGPGEMVVVVSVGSSNEPSLPSKVVCVLTGQHSTAFGTALSGAANNSTPKSLLEYVVATLPVIPDLQNQLGIFKPTVTTKGMEVTLPLGWNAQLGSEKGYFSINEKKSN
jgi:hypothetical protein